jgi:hypothetical protein
VTLTELVEARCGLRVDKISLDRLGEQAVLAE